MKPEDKFDVLFFCTMVLFVWALVTELHAPSAVSHHGKSVQEQIEELRQRVELLQKQGK